jgi:hypothetical protein
MPFLLEKKNHKLALDFLMMVTRHRVHTTNVYASKNWREKNFYSLNNWREKMLHSDSLKSLKKDFFLESKIVIGDFNQVMDVKEKNEVIVLEIPTGKQ